MSPGAGLVPYAGSSTAFGVPDRLGRIPSCRRCASRYDALRTELADSEAEVKTLRSELGRTRDSVRDPDPTVVLPDSVTQTIAQVRNERLTYLKEANLGCARPHRGRPGTSDQTPGLIIEAGTARGGSAIVMAAAKAAERPMKVVRRVRDDPAAHREGRRRRPPPLRIITRGESKGVAGDTYYGYRDDLYSEVTESFDRLGVEVGAHNVELLQGLFADTLVLDEPVALAHLDGDWYESTMTCLERIAPLLVPGGRIVLDDYYAWSGCRTAVDEYFAGRAGFRIERRAKVHVVRL